MTSTNLQRHRRKKRGGGGGGRREGKKGTEKRFKPNSSEKRNSNKQNVFYIILVERLNYSPFSVSEQPKCALVVCDSECVTVALHSASLNIYLPKGLLTALFGF